MTKHAAIYCRISDDRRGEAAGVKRQEEDCRRLAQQRGWEVVRVLVDNDVSAYSGKVRPEYQRLLEGIRSGAVDAVIAWHPDRLHRSPRELEDFIEVVDRAKAAVVTVMAGEYDLSTASGRQNARIVGAVARGESERMGDRIRRAHAQLAQEGRLNGGGSRPFGFENDRITVRASEAAHIRDAARRILAGETMSGIVREWNARGVKTAGGMVWDVAGLRQVLVSARISGRREHKGQVTGTAVWPAIIDPKDSDRLRLHLGPARGRRPGRPSEFLLSGGLLICGRCGVPLAAGRSPTRVAELRAGAGKYEIRSYSCTRHPRSRPTACNRLRIRAEGLEALVAELVFQAIDSPKLASRVAVRQKASRKRQTAFDEVAEIETDLQQLASAFGEGRIPYAEWIAARKPLDRRLAEARNRLAQENGTTPLNGLAGKPGALRKAWPTLNLDRRKAILGAVIESITVKPADPQKPRNLFDPERIAVRWKV